MSIFLRSLALVIVLCSVVNAEQTVLVEVESFDTLGGWVVDQQSIGQMGSPYLLAHGMGVPVADASKTVEFPSLGKYNVWVRTRDWVAPWNAPGAPGKFQLLVDGKTLPTVFGTEGAQWHWQSGGTVDINRKNIKIALHDLTGFEGRCDAIVFTKDSSLIVPNDREELSEFRHMMLKLPYNPEDAGHFDVVVVGGGMSGICAAISAARLGLEVALIQDRPVLGGNNSSEIRVLLNGEVNLPPYQAIGDLVRELDCGYWGNGGEAKEYRDGRKLRITQAEENLHLFLNTHAFKVKMKDGKIVAVIAMNTMTSRQTKFEGDLFVDCTGDGTIGYLAGADYRMGREGRDETEESLAPEKGDKMTLGMTNQWHSEMKDEAAPFPDCPWAVQFNDKTYQPGPAGGWNWEAGMNRDQITETEFVRDYNFRVIYGNWAFLKNHSRQKTGYTNRQLKWLGYIGGKRESRRLLGDLILREQDIREDKIYPDAFVVSTWTIDLHIPQEANSKHFPGNEFRSTAQQTAKNPYPIPYRCFYSRNVPNLMMAGRNISTTHVAMGTTRVMRTCGMMGEVVGMAASLCKKYDATPRQVYSDHLDELKELATKGVGKFKRKEIMTIPPEWINDAGENLALKAKVRVSSSLDEEMHPLANINDGIIDVRDRNSPWISEEGMPQWVEFSWKSPQRINAVRCVSGRFFRISSSPQDMNSDFVFQYEERGWFRKKWKDLPGTRVSGSRRFDWSERFEEIRTKKIRMNITAVRRDLVRLMEVEFYNVKDNADASPPSKQVKSAPATGAPRIGSNYECGNIIVDKIESDVVYLRQDLRDTKGWWFYWNFEAKVTTPKTVTFKFTDGNPIGSMGPAVSTDRGLNWSWLGAESVSDSSFKYTFKGDGKNVRFCFTIPYPARYVYQGPSSANVETQELCKSRKGRAVPMWRFGKLDGECLHRIMITARHHACESIASFVLEGIIEAVYADTPEGKWFRENVEVAAVPFVDFDGALDGDQGKNRKPHDHNRDYGGESIYPAVKAIREFVPQWSDGKLIATFDLHCPWIRGSHEETIYIVGSSDPAVWKEQSKFADILQETQTGTLVYRVSDNLPSGKGWNTGANYGSKKSCSKWMREQEGVKLATGIETPYALAVDKIVTAEAAREFGHDLARSMYHYLK